MLFDDYGDLLNLNDICTLLDIKPATAARLCRSGQIKAFKVRAIICLMIDHSPQTKNAPGS